MDQLKNIKQKIARILNKYNINQATIVGSYAHGQQTETSDIDIVVTIDYKLSLLTFSKIKIELEEALHRKVDLIERTAIKPSLKKYLLEKELPVF